MKTPARSFRQELQATRQDHCEVLLEQGPVEEAMDLLSTWLEGASALVVTTPTVHALYGAAIRRLPCARGEPLVLRCDEATKSVSMVQRIVARAAACDLPRDGFVVGIGGGICTDLTTVAAAWIRRGTRHIRIPTTLIGQSDAGVGLKGAVNLGDRKSYLGCYHSPHRVLIAPVFLATLPVRHLRDGFAEILKIALVRDPGLFALLEEWGGTLVGTGFQAPRRIGVEVIWKAATLMMEELAQNPYERCNYERVVDFGHTFSPSIEAGSGYRISHGEAVAIDMALSVCIATRLGLLEAALRDRVITLLRTNGLPTDSSLLTLDRCEDSLRQAALHRGGRANLVLPTSLGRATFINALDRGVLGSALLDLRGLEAQTGHEQATG